MDGHNVNEEINAMSSNGGNSLALPFILHPMRIEPNGKGHADTSNNHSLIGLAHAVKDVHKEFEPLKDMVKHILNNISMVEKTKEETTEHRTSTKYSGGLISVDIEDFPRNNSTPVSNKSKTTSCGKTKSKPLGCSSKKNITLRLENIETMLLVNSDDEMLSKDIESFKQPPRVHKKESKSNIRSKKRHKGYAAKEKVKVEQDYVETCVKLEKVDDESFNIPQTRRSLRSKPPQMSLMESVVPKLLCNASTSNRPKKIPKMTNTTSLAQPSKECNVVDVSVMSKSNNVLKAHGHTLPKFAPTPEMGLSKEQAQVCAYLFHPNMDPREFLFLTDTMVGRRSDFQTLIPPNIINDRAEAISGIIAIGNYNEIFLHGMHDFSKWDIVEPRGLPNPVDRSSSFRTLH
ncbi:hypothetical protein SESBI_40218 [Sesbania bispinosa]|nr:hypothetical protein SESBI_40218 [Sesbania bispinosa]